MIEPLGKRVVIKRDPPKTELKTHAEAVGIIIPENHQKPELSGIVLAVGKEVTEAVVGDRVIFGKFDGQDLDDKYTGEKGCIIINEEQIKGIYV